MDRQHVISIPLEVVLEMLREETRRMEESLRDDQDALLEKVRERSMLMREMQGILAKEAPKEKLVDDLMVFFEATRNDDHEIVPNFDEKAMMNNILAVMNSEGCGTGGLACIYGDDVPKVGLDLEKVTMETILDLGNSYDSCGGDEGGFSGHFGDDVPKIELDLEENGIADKPAAMMNKDGGGGGVNGGFAGKSGDDVPKIKLGLEEKATMDTTVALVKSDGSCGSDNGGFTRDYESGGVNNAPVNLQRLGEGAIMATTAIEGGNKQ